MLNIYLHAAMMLLLMMNIYMIPIKENIDAWHHRETRAGYRTDIIGIDTSGCQGVSADPTSNCYGNSGLKHYK